MKVVNKEKQSSNYDDEIASWFDRKKWKVFPFQNKAWQAYAEKKSGIVNAPTGSGKTYSLMVPAFSQFFNKKETKGLRVLWITPIRALSKEIFISANRLNEQLGLNVTIETRTGDTTASQKKRQAKRLPNVLITTPESLHLLIAQKGSAKMFSKLESIIVDEWHELIGSKRGVLVELGISRLIACNNCLRVWGISATIGNLHQAMEVLLGMKHAQKGMVIRSDIKKEIVVESLMPDKIENLPWTGHLGIKLLDKVLPVIYKSKSTLIFTNTRSQCEIWYQRILDTAPELAGVIAMHHGSMSRDMRNWVEDALYDGRLKAVVCTSSLDLGVDFLPVESIVQVGSPKGVARFVQRAGRSGHQPGAKSKIYFLPTHTLELVEAAALRQAIDDEYMEEREPYFRSFDVLVQYLVTLAVSDGFLPDDIKEEVQNTFSYNSMSDEEWQWCLSFITTGGASLKAYPEFKKVEIDEGVFKVKARRIAMRHRMSIGTIVGDSAIWIKYKRGPSLGSIEESFISKLNVGDAFWFAGRAIELVQIKDMNAIVVNSTKKNARIPSWSGGRLPLSSKMSEMLRLKLNEIAQQNIKDIELEKIQPMTSIQEFNSSVPAKDEFLVEQFETEEGHHIIMYPFEGRLVHEGLASLIAWRISQVLSITFSLAYNDYGFELLSDQSVNLNAEEIQELFSPENVDEDTQAGINSTEMSQRRFRDIAVIAGMIFRGFPGVPIKDRHIQSSSRLIFDVFRDYDSKNLLYRQAFNEVIDYQLEMNRFRDVIYRVNKQKVVLTFPDGPSPFSFPIIADRLREKLSSETVAERLMKLSLNFK